MIDNIEDAKEQIADYFADHDKELKEAIKANNPSDILSELANSNVEIHTYNLLEWIKGNYSIVEDAIEEIGFSKNQEGKPDFIKTIMQGQYYANELLLWEAWQELIDETEEQEA